MSYRHENQDFTRTLAISKCVPARYSHVLSWLIDLNDDPLDECEHGFVLPAGISSEQRIREISDALGARMWCDIDGEYIEPEDFDPDSYHSTHVLIP